MSDQKSRGPRTSSTPAANVGAGVKRPKIDGKNDVKPGKAASKVVAAAKDAVKSAPAAASVEAAAHAVSGAAQTAPAAAPVAAPAKAAAAPIPAPTLSVAPAPKPEPKPVPAPKVAVATKPEPVPAPKVAAAPKPEPVPAPKVAPAPAPKVAAREPERDLAGQAFSAVGIQPLPDSERIAAPMGLAMKASADGARAAYAKARESNEAIGHAYFESAAAASRGMVALNGQMLDLMRAQSDLGFALMRATLSAGSLSEAVKAQTSGARQAYETTSVHLKAIAETTTRLVGETTKPIKDAMAKR